MRGITHPRAERGSSAAPSNDFTLTGVDPNRSLDLNGGERVEISGTNFEDLEVAGAFAGTISFGAAIAFDPEVMDDNTLEVTVPPAPGGLPGVVSIEVRVDGFPTRVLSGAFTYQGLSGPPVIDSIFPTTFTPSGAEQFTIQGSNLGLDGDESAWIGQFGRRHAGLDRGATRVARDGAIVAKVFGP